MGKAYVYSVTTAAQVGVRAELEGGRSREAQTLELLRRRLSSHGGRETLHWHVFDFDLLVQLMDCLGYRVEFMALWAPFHQVIVGRKRAAALLEA